MGTFLLWEVIYDLNLLCSFSMAGIRLIFLNLNSLDVELGLLLADGAKSCVFAGCSSSVSERELRKERCLLMMDSSRFALSS